MNKIERGKTALLALSIISLIASIIFLVLGVALVVNSLVGGSVQIVKLVFGILSILLSVPLVIFGIYGLFVGIALKATKGSIAEGNLGKGTVNAKLCSNCGNQLNGEEFCPKCGAGADGKIICKKCNAQNDISNVNCTACGETLR